jgi:hypothetical protein
VKLWGFDFNNRAGRNEIMNCTKCNKKLLKTDKYCTNCGTERINLDESEELFDNGEFHNDNMPKNRNDKNIKLIRIAKKSPWYVWIIGIVFIVILVNVLIQNNNPQETVKGFFKALESRDLNKAGEYIHPSLPWDVEAGKRIGIPKNASINILNIEEKKVGDRAKLKVTIDISPKPLYGPNPDNITIDLKKVDGKWLIYDMQ